MTTWQLKCSDYLGSNAPLRRKSNKIKRNPQKESKAVSMCLGRLLAAPWISEAAVVNPDCAVAPSQDLWQTALATTGFRTVQDIDQMCKQTQSRQRYLQDGQSSVFAIARANNDLQVGFRVALKLLEK